MLDDYLNAIKRFKEPVVYTPESPILHPWKLMTGMLRDVGKSWPLARRLIIRDLTAQYRQTIFGYLWAIIPPLATALIFIFLNSAKILAVPQTEVPYPVYVMTGTIFWQLFVDALNGPLKEINLNRSMLTKVDFPKEALIISSIGQVLFSFFIKLILLTVILVIFRVSVQWTIILLIFPMAGLLGMGILIGVLLVPLGVLYKDIQQGLALIIQPLMLLTPVIYPPPSEGILAKIMNLNPITPLILAVRDCIFTGFPRPLIPFVTVCGITFLLLFLGWIIYRLALPILIERMEA